MTSRFSFFVPPCSPRAAAVAAALLATTGSLLAQPTTFTPSGEGETLWSNPANWSDGVPTTSSNVVLPAGEFSSIYAESYEVIDVVMGDDGLLSIAGGDALTATGAAGVSLGDGAMIDGYYGQGRLFTSLLFSSGNSVNRAELSYLSDQLLTLRQAPGGTHTIEAPINLTGPGQSTLVFDAQTTSEVSHSRIEVRRNEDDGSEGTIQGSFGDGDFLLVEVRGGGTTALYSDSTYQGTTRVLGGTTPFGENGHIWSGGLYVLNDASTGGSATGTSTVEVVWNGIGPDADYGILGGDGRIGGDLRHMGGLILPGNADFNVGTLTVDGTYTGEYGASYDEMGNVTGYFVGDLAIDLDPTDSEGGGLHDQLLLTLAGAAHTIGGTNLSLFLKSAPTEGQIFRIIEAAADATITGTFENWAGTGATGTASMWDGSQSVDYTFTIIYGSHFVDLVAGSVAIPEPGTWALFAGVAALAAVISRRRRA